MPTNSFFYLLIKQFLNLTDLNFSTTSFKDELSDKVICPNFFFFQNHNLKEISKIF